MVFGDAEVTQGASGDLQMVSQIAREMVTRYGFSMLGPMALEQEGVRYSSDAIGRGQSTAIQITRPPK